MDAVIKLDTTAPASVIGSIKDCLEQQLQNVPDRVDYDSINYVYGIVSALHTMFVTQQPYALYASLQKFLEAIFCETEILYRNRFKLPDNQQASDMLCEHMNVLLGDSLRNICTMAHTCAGGMISVSTSNKIHSYGTHPNKKDEEEDIKWGNFYDLAVDEEEDGTHVYFKFNKEKYDKYWTQFKAREKKYGWDKCKLIIRGF